MYICTNTPKGSHLYMHIPSGQTGQHCPGGVTASPQAGRAHSTAEQSTGTAVVVNDQDVYLWELKGLITVNAGGGATPQ